MKAAFPALAASAVLLVGLGGADTALAQKQGGTLRVYHRDSPASMSIHEEGTVGVSMPMMDVFNNLVIFDQHVRKTAYSRSFPSSPPAGHASELPATVSPVGSDPLSRTLPATIRLSSSVPVAIPLVGRSRQLTLNIAGLTLNFKKSLSLPP
jgi:hypothetical protein